MRNRDRKDRCSCCGGNKEKCTYSKNSKGIEYVTCDRCRRRNRIKKKMQAVERQRRIEEEGESENQRAEAAEARVRIQIRRHHGRCEECGVFMKDAGVRHCNGNEVPIVWYMRCSKCGVEHTAPQYTEQAKKMLLEKAGICQRKRRKKVISRIIR